MGISIPRAHRLGAALGLHRMNGWILRLVLTLGALSACQPWLMDCSACASRMLHYRLEEFCPSLKSSIRQVSLHGRQSYFERYTGSGIPQKRTHLILRVSFYRTSSGPQSTARVCTFLTPSLISSPPSWRLMSQLSTQIPVSM